MMLYELIELLEQYDPHRVVPMGFSNPHSYRGDYGQLAFEPTANVTVQSMLTAAREAIGYTYEGYKGGEFTMDKDVDVYIATWGCTGEAIGVILFNYMVGNYYAKC